MSEKCCKIKTMIGGQALIEGIMMRGPDKTATVLLKSDGSHVCREKEYIPPKKKCFLFGWPIIRGVAAFVGSIGGGMSELLWSADNVEVAEEEEPSKFDAWIEKKFGMEKAQKFLMGFAVALGILLPIGLFILLPSLITDLIAPIFPNVALRALSEGVLKIAIFLIFLWLSSRMGEMKRLYAFHGAEHKTIHCYEAGEELTVENVRRHTRRHPRCGTSFLFVVILISVLVYSFIRIENVWLRMVLRIALLPLVVGISYEFNRLVGRYDNFLTKLLRLPGIALQGITTNEPDDDMIAVAIDALERVIPEEKGADRW